MREISGYESVDGKVFKTKNQAVARDIVYALDKYGAEIDQEDALALANNSEFFIDILKQMEVE